MAQIKNIQLKSIKYFTGREGYGYNTNIYFKGKMIGTAFDAADGGCLDVTISDKTISAEVVDLSKQYFKEHPKYMFNSSDSDYIEAIIEELLYLNEIEKAFKKGAKKGFPITLNLKYNKRDIEPFGDDYVQEDDTVVNVNEWNESVELYIKTNYKNPKVVDVYKSLNDFIIG